jgi:large subunit ribosomal protein L30
MKMIQKTNTSSTKTSGAKSGAKKLGAKDSTKDTSKDVKSDVDPKAMIAMIRIRGTDDVNNDIVDTMIMLRLHKKHTCSIYPAGKNILGMAQKCRDYITYGEIDDETYKLLVEKRGIKKDGKLTNYFHLHPPRGGFGRRGIKYSFTQKGALGYRGTEINVLIKKML